MATKISDISFLEGLANEMERCSKVSMAHLPAIDDFINSKLILFQEIDNELHNRLQDCQTRLNNRNNLLTLCKARVEYDKNGYRKAPDCTSEERDTRVAKAALDAARNNVNSMNDFKRQVADLMAAHSERSNRYKKANTSFSQNSIAYLNNVVKNFHQYVELRKRYGSTE